MNPHVGCGLSRPTAGKGHRSKAARLMRVFDVVPEPDGLVTFWTRLERPKDRREGLFLVPVPDQLLTSTWPMLYGSKQGV